MTVIPSAARTVLQFSMIQCIWCSGEVVSANVPIRFNHKFISTQKSPPRGPGMKNETKRTLKKIQQPARSRIPRKAILMLQILQQQNDM